MTRNNDGTFKKGQSGNPAGKSKGTTGIAAQIRKAIAAKAPEIVEVLIKQALNGDTQASLALLNRISPTLKAVNQEVQFKLDTSKGLSGTGEQIVQAISSGETPLDSGLTMLGGLANLSKLQEMDGLIQRIEALERTK